MHPELFLGVDAGGTKTLAVVADAKGNVRGTGRAGCGNWEGVGLARAGDALAAAIDGALDQAGAASSHVLAAGYGLAGLDWPDDEVNLAEVIDAFGIPGPRTLVNDGYVALAAGAPSGYGIGIIAGTGSMVAGVNSAGERWRTFGSGREWGDAGGGIDLVQRALKSVSMAYFGLGPETVLTERFVDACGARDLADLAQMAMRAPASPITGNLAPLVTAAANQGDPVAVEVVRTMGSEIGMLAVAIAQRLGLDRDTLDLVMAGSVLSSGCVPLIEALTETVRAKVRELRPVALDVPPVMGGVVLAMQAAGTPPSEKVRQNLQRTLGAA